MQLSDYCNFDGVGLADLIASGACSIREVTEASLAAMAAINPTLNAVIEQYTDVFDEAKLGDGPLRGVPFLIKDVGEHFGGRLAESGSRLCKGLVAGRNDYFADLVLASGVNPVGRSNVPEFSMASCACNQLHGDTSNPWRHGFSTHGSSGGAAAAVAAGIVPIAHASDIGGSIRAPAAWCGTVGLYPSRGRVSIGPFAGEHGLGMAQALVVTRTMRDTALMLDLLGRPMPGDPYVIARPPGTFSSHIHHDPRSIRVGWSARPLMDAPVDPEIAAAVEKVARVLADNGCHVEEAQPDIDLALMDEGCKNIWYLGFDSHLDELGARAGRKVGPDTVSRATLGFYEFAKRQTPEAYFRTMDDFNRMRRDAARFFSRFDVWLSPTCAQVAQPNGVFGMDIDLPPDEFLRHEQRVSQFMVPYNVWGQPAISLPLATHSNGLPIGIQLGARHAEEHLLIALGGFLEQAMPWKDRRPPLHALA